MRDSVRHAKRERGQDEVDEGGVPHEPVDSRVAPAGGALPQEHAYEEGQAIEGGDEYDDAKEARHELKRVGARLWREAGGEHGASLDLGYRTGRDYSSSGWSKMMRTVSPTRAVLPHIGSVAIATGVPLSLVL